MWPLNQNSLPQWHGGTQPFTPVKPNGNFTHIFAQAQPSLGQNMPWANLGGFNPGPNLPLVNRPFTLVPWPTTPVKSEWKIGDDYFAGLVNLKDGFNGGSVKDGRKPGPLSGKGSIDGVNFRSGDGERYELKVEAGKSYNLLSDAGIGLNGTYGTKSDETVLTDIALSVGGKIVTLADDGTLRVDGKAFDKRKNNLGGLVTENKDGTYSVKANGYEFELKATDAGIRVKIDAKNARAPEGLWGVALDGEKNTERELQKAIKESDYVIDDALTFDYEENNNIGEKYTPDLDDEERANLAWTARNPEMETKKFALFLNMDADGQRRDFGIWGDKDIRPDDAYWTMDKLQKGRVYNVFSDEDIQVNGKFDGGKPTELGFTVNGDNVKVERSGNGIKLTVNDEVVTSYNNNGITFSRGNLNIKSDSDEGWSFTVSADGRNSKALSMRIDADKAGDNATRSTGLLGDAVTANVKDNGNDANGAGYLRDVDGFVSKAGADMTKALREYLMDDLFDTDNGRSVYD